MDEQVIQTATGLEYVEIVEGTGPRPKAGDTVSVHYTGWLKSGQKFDSSVDRGEPFAFPIGKGRVIKGWDEGVGTMKVGGKRKLIIPAHLGYGERGAGGVIPPVKEVEAQERAPAKTATPWAGAGARRGRPRSTSLGCAPDLRASSSAGGPG